MADYRFSTDGVFNHHWPISETDMIAWTLPGLDGAFAQRLQIEGLDPTEPTMGMIVQVSSRGDLQGVRLLKTGKVKPKDLNSQDFWPDAEKARIVIPEFDLSDFGKYNGCLTTPYRDIPYKVQFKKENGNWSSIKKAN